MCGLEMLLFFAWALMTVGWGTALLVYGAIQAFRRSRS